MTPGVRTTPAAAGGVPSPAGVGARARPGWGREQGSASTTVAAGSDRIATTGGEGGLGLGLFLLLAGAAGVSLGRRRPA
ncbi:MAG: hypothetical protein ACRD2W_20245 [Acidimicrobiales bacterium]